MTQYNEYPEITIPPFVDNDNWRDDSWHNDITAHSTYIRPLYNGAELELWVFSDNPAEREVFNAKKYLVRIVDNGGSELISQEFDESGNTRITLNQLIDWLAI